MSRKKGGTVWRRIGNNETRGKIMTCVLSCMRVGGRLEANGRLSMA